MLSNVVISDQIAGEFKSILSSLKSDQLNHAENIITSCDGFLIIWSDRDSCLYCLLMKHDSSIHRVQKLVLTNAPVFHVNSIKINNNGRYALLSGERGMMLVEMPRKWGPQNMYEGGKGPIICRSHCVAERFFVCNLKIQLHNCCWHPGSDSHIVFLANDDYLRLIEVSHPQKFHQEINISISQSQYDRFSKFAHVLGELAIAFDFASPIPSQPTEPHETDLKIIYERSPIWPVYILRGNGDIILIYHNLHNDYISRNIIGPLVVRPPSEDNYGNGACSLICIESTPTILAIATSGGIIHHCLALDDENSLMERLKKPIIYVYESLDITPSLTPLKEDSDYFYSSVRLTKVPGNESIYFCTHLAGVQIVHCPLVAKFRNDDYALDSSDESVLEDIVCTQPLLNSSGDNLIVVKGVTVHSMGGSLGSLVVCLSNGEMLSQRLSPLFVSQLKEFENKNSTPKEENDKAKLCSTVGFNVYVGQILKRDLNAPIIKSDMDKEPSKEVCLQLLLNTTEILRKEYLVRMEAAAEVITKRMASLDTNLGVQVDELSECFDKKNEFSTSCDNLILRYGECVLKQNELFKKTESVLDYLYSKQNNLSEAENVLRKELETLKSKIMSYEYKFDQVKLKFDYQKDLNAPKIVEKSEVGPVPNQIKAIRQILADQ